MSTWTWFRMTATRRWRSLLLLALLTAVSAATVMTAVAGARRGASALQRLAAQTIPATVDVAPLQPGFDWKPVETLPEVEIIARYADTDFRVEGIPPDDLSVGYPPLDGTWMQTVERPVVLEGRLAEPSRIDEVVVTHRFVTTYGKGVGDFLTAVLPTPEQAQALGISVPAPSGPRIPMRIVGVVRSPFFTDGPTSRGTLMPTPALLRTFGPNLLNDYTWLNALIRLRGGEAAVPAFRAHLAAVTGRSDVLVDNLAELRRNREGVARFEAQWLLAFGGAALLAAVLLVGQAVGRYVNASLADLATVQALGMTRLQVVIAATAAPTLAAAVGASLASGAAMVASAWFPIGSAAADEPMPGLDVDPFVLGVGTTLTVVLVLAGSAAVALVAVLRVGVPTLRRRSVIASAAAAAHLPIPVVLGTRFALEPGRGPSSVPVRPALLGSVAGVLGVVAAFTFSSGISEAAHNPARFGQTWQLETWMGFAGKDFAPPDLLQQAARDRDVAAINEWRAAVATETRHQTALILYTYAAVGHPIQVVLQEGHLPISASEVVLAPGSAAAASVHVGDRVTMTGTAGRQHTMTVTGIGFVPAGSHCTGCSHNIGGWVTDEGFDATFDAFQFHGGFIVVRQGAVVQDVAARLQSLAPASGGQGLIAPPYPPSAITELRQVQPFPLYLAAFLTVLAIGAVGHALASAVRRRRHDLAVLRAMGMTRRQSRLVVVTQASLLAGVGLVFGIPLGIAAGRTLWRAVAASTPVQYVPPVAGLALVSIVPLTLLAANLLAAWPGRRAARLHVGHVLRAE